ncbi:MAG: hypothetical protein AAGH78_16525 [Cyanobacteria bacterium P01_H01_bin.58]
MTVSPNPPRNASRRSASPWGIALVVVASAAAHGALLGLPWPFASEPFELSEPVLSELDDPSLMDIAVLPRNLLESDNLEATDAEAEAELEVTPQQQTTDSEPEPEPSLSQEPEPKLEPEPEPESKPEPESETLPTLPGEDDADPIGGLPEEPGLTPSTQPITRPLAQRLADPSEYSYSQSGQLSQIESYSESAKWTVDPNRSHPKNIYAPLNISYELGNDCPSGTAGKPKDGVLAVRLDANDNIIAGPNGETEPVMISSTGYKVLDEKAIQEAKERVGTSFFEPRQTDAAYMITVAVNGYPAHCPQ